MNKVEKVIVVLGATSIALMLLHHYRESKKSNFVDDKLSSADGVKKFKPNSWAKLNGQWTWVNSEGDLTV